MDSKKDYIENLYSEKFESFESQISNEDWNKLNLKLSKSNFLKFSFATFNVFFLGAFLAFAGTISVLSVTTIRQSEKIKTLEKKIDVMHKHQNKNENYPLITDSLIIQKQDNIELQSKNEKKDNELTKNTFDKNVPDVNTSPQLISKKDSVYLKPDSLTDIKPEPQKIKKIKKTIFIKKENVLVTDTVIIKKKVK